jgi:hypothetical protein
MGDTEVDGRRRRGEEENTKLDLKESVCGPGYCSVL